jgi:hypothetical protein
VSGLFLVYDYGVVAEQGHEQLGVAVRIKLEVAANYGWKMLKHALPASDSRRWG